MAQTKVHPEWNDAETFFIGATPDFIEVGFGADVSTKTGPDSTIQTVIRAIQNENVTILGHSALYDAGASMAIMMQDAKGTDTWDGTNSETFEVYLTSVLVALGIVDGVNLAGATVTAKTFELA